MSGVLFASRARANESERDDAAGVAGSPRSARGDRDAFFLPSPDRSIVRLGAERIKNKTARRRARSLRTLSVAAFGMERDRVITGRQSPGSAARSYRPRAPTIVPLARDRYPRTRAQKPPPRRRRTLEDRAASENPRARPTPRTRRFGFFSLWFVGFDERRVRARARGVPLSIPPHRTPLFFFSHASQEGGRHRHGFDFGRRFCWRGPHRCLLYTSPSPRDGLLSRMPSSA